MITHTVIERFKKLKIHPICFFILTKIANFYCISPSVIYRMILILVFDFHFEDPDP